VIDGIRLRAGRAASGKGAASMVTEATHTVRAAVPGCEILVPGDSAQAQPTRRDTRVSDVNRRHRPDLSGQWSDTDRRITMLSPVETADSGQSNIEASADHGDDQRHRLSVFVSHTYGRQTDEVTALLAAAGLQPFGWKNIPPGASWADSLLEALDDCYGLVAFADDAKFINGGTPGNWSGAWQGQTGRPPH
jgi:hypothetical protein